MSVASWTTLACCALCVAPLGLLGWTWMLRGWRRELLVRERAVDDRTDEVARAQHDLYLAVKRVDREQRLWKRVARDPERARLGEQLDVLRAELALRVELLSLLRDRDPDLLLRAERDLTLRRGHWCRLATREALLAHAHTPEERYPPAAGV